MDLDAVRRWGYRIGWQAAGAIHLADRLAELAGTGGGRLASISRYFGTNNPSHAFHAEPIGWLRLTEVQITQGLAIFLRAGGSRRVGAFLRALNPAIDWPEAFTKISVVAELPVRGGRIDLFIRAECDGVAWGAVVEAKINHHLADNPLPEYARTAATRGLRLGPTPTDNQTGCLVVLGRNVSSKDRRRLGRNRRWRFVTWSAMLRRLEFELADFSDDDEFRRFRRTLWDRCT